MRSGPLFYSRFSVYFALSICNVIFSYAWYCSGTDCMGICNWPVEKYLGSGNYFRGQYSEKKKKYYKLMKNAWNSESFITPDRIVPVRSYKKLSCYTGRLRQSSGWICEFLQKSRKITFFRIWGLNPPFVRLWINYLSPY